jgi:hypothetical protein
VDAVASRCELAAYTARGENTGGCDGPPRLAWLETASTVDTATSPSAVLGARPPAVSA